MIALEVNGPANIVQAVRHAQRTGKPLNLAYIEAQALATIAYMQARETNKEIGWLDFKPAVMPMLLEPQCESSNPARNAASL